MINTVTKTEERKVECPEGGNDMLTEIKAREEKRVSEFRRQYADKWFSYVVLNPDDDDDDPVVMVTYVADTKKEIYSASDDEYIEKGYTVFGVEWGENVDPEPGIRIGGLGFGFI